MSDVTRTDSPSSQPAPTPIRWRSWPLRDDPVRKSPAAAAVLLVGLLVHVFTGQISLAIVAAAALAAALWRVFLPVVYELNHEGIQQWIFGRHRRIRWSAVARYEICSAGVLLLPRAERTPLAPLRGLYLPFASLREEILVQVNYYLEKPEQAPAENVTS